MVDAGEVRGVGVHGFEVDAVVQTLEVVLQLDEGGAARCGAGELGASEEGRRVGVSMRCEEA